MAIDGVSGALKKVTQSVQTAASTVAESAKAVVSAAAGPVGYSTADTFEPAAAQKTTEAAQAKGGENVPPMPSFQGTVQTGTTPPLSDTEKTARGALKVDQRTPEKYDGMYIGADGWAYPPEKFSVTEVPPFRPSSPVSNPPPTTYYVNGIMTWPSDGGAPDSPTSPQANGEAQKLANKTGTNVVLIYNATSGNFAGDLAQSVTDRDQTGDDKAEKTLENLIYNDVKAGRKVNVTGYSQGGAIVSYALRNVDDRIADEQGWTSRLPVVGAGQSDDRARMLSNVNVVTFGGAGKDFPDGPKYTFYVNQQDPIPNYFGAHDFNPGTDLPELALTALNPLLVPIVNDGLPFFHARGAQVPTFSDHGKSSNPFDTHGTHGIDTYFDHIPSSTT